MTRPFHNMLYEGQVLVNGADTVTGYNAALALRKTGLTIYGQARARESAYTKSRIWKKVFYSNFDIDNLKRISIEIKSAEDSKGINPALLISQDSAVGYAARHRDELTRHYKFSLPDYNVVNRLLDKTLFHSWAIDNDILVPESRIVEDDDSLKQALEELDYPVIIKPLIRTELWDSGLHNAKLIYLGCYEDKDKIPDNILGLCKRFVVQEWIPGGDEEVYFVLAYINEQQECISLAGQKLVQWPTLSGSTAVCISINDEALVDLGLNILKKSGLVGLGSIEFKRHKENNSYYVTEPTVGRNDYQSYLAPASNRNLSLYYVLDCMEYSYLVNTDQLKAVWIDEISCLRLVISCYRKSASLLRVFILFKYKKSFANWSLYDPITFYRIISGLIKERIKAKLIKSGK